MPTVNTFTGSTASPLQGFFRETLSSASPLANVFFTGFDQHSPIPLGPDDLYMADTNDMAPVDHA